MSSDPAPLPRLDDHDIYPSLRRIPGPALVLVTTPFCGGCRHLVKTLQELKAAGWAVPVFEVDARDGAGLVNELELFHLPAMVLYVDGDYHRALSCPAEPRIIMKAVAQAAAAPPEDEDEET